MIRRLELVTRRCLRFSKIAAPHFVFSAVGAIFLAPIFTSQFATCGSVGRHKNTTVYSACNIDHTIGPSVSWVRNVGAKLCTHVRPLLPVWALSTPDTKNGGSTALGGGCVLSLTFLQRSPALEKRIPPLCLAGLSLTTTSLTTATKKCELLCEAAWKSTGRGGL